jgi:hypothetical protein
VIVKPGPTVPVSFTGAACEGALRARAPTTTAARSASVRARIKTNLLPSVDLLLPG